MSEEHKKFLREAFDMYLELLHGSTLEPEDGYLPYEFEEIQSRKWGVLGNQMVDDEIRELTNCLNAWRNGLLRWHAWNKVSKNYDQSQAWDLRIEFLNACAHRCLFTPSEIRDKLTFVVTNAIHQVRLSLSKDYLDFLEGDKEKPDVTPKALNRKQKESRLKKLLEPWDLGNEFMGLLRSINDREYCFSTSDYRNRNAHAIGPNLGLGITRTVVRSMTQPTQMVKRPDGFFDAVPIPNVMVPSYSFGGTEPLDLERARVLNLEQYKRARQCFESYWRLLRAVMAEMKEHDSSVLTAS